MSAVAALQEAIAVADHAIDALEAVCCSGRWTHHSGLVYNEVDGDDVVTLSAAIQGVKSVRAKLLDRLHDWTRCAG